MRNFNFAYIFVLFLSLPLLNSCDQAPNKNRIIVAIADAMEAQKQQYFDVDFQLIEVQSNQVLHKLTASASLKTGKYGNISKAYFTIEGGGQLHYLQTISDLQSPIYLLESNELDQNKAANVYDSINSPLKLNPGLIREWLHAAHHMEVTNDQVNSMVDVEFQLATQTIKFSWNNDEQRLKTLELLDDNAYSYQWKFNYLTEPTFLAQEKVNRQVMVNQNHEFL